MSSTWRHLGALRTVAEFQRRLAELGLDLPCDAAIEPGSASPLASAIATPRINGKSIGNRWAIHPMEGWDGSRDGGVTDAVRRRWQRFGESGAKLICGGEAMAVRHDGRANPHQLVIGQHTCGELTELLELVRSVHARRYGSSDDLVVGFQLTHSGRFSRPSAADQPAPRVAMRHPLLDARFHVTSDAQVLSDAEVDELIDCFVGAAAVAHQAGADFVDIKHCHGYLWHEFLGAHRRQGRYGGSFENRTRPLRAIVAGIRASGNPIDLAVRLSVFDSVPFQALLAQAGQRDGGFGVPADVTGHLPYDYGFGIDRHRPSETDLREPLQFVALCRELGVKILNASAGSPYYCPHLQRPAAYPPSDGYAVDHDPLIDAVRLIGVARQVRAVAGPAMVVVGTGYSYLQDFLPLVAQAVVREGWTDLVGLGRMVLSYPELPADVLAGRGLARKLVCRTFSDCTTAPRLGLPSGCYPLDHHYRAAPAADQLKQLKQRRPGGE